MSEKKSAERVRVIVHGALGRMGSRVCAMIAARDDVRLVGATDERARVSRDARIDDGRGAFVDVQIADDVREIADVVVDFTGEHGTLKGVELARRARAALLVGTTGLTPSTVELLRDFSSERAVLVAPNTSLGVAVLAHLSTIAARSLPGYHASIVESHHAMKKDSPSGTAIRLAKAVRSAGMELPDSSVVSTRGGDVIGEHTVRLAGEGEYIELVHRATSRDLFARGAVIGAVWLAGQPAGMYTMEDALGFADDRD